MTHEWDDAHGDRSPGGAAAADITRRIQLQAIGIVAVAIALVAGAAFFLEQRFTDDDQDFGTLEADATPIDESRAELARRIRDAVVVVDSDPAAIVGGVRGSGRGWVLGNVRNDDDNSLFTSLSAELGDVGELLVALGNEDVLVYACGEAFGVFVKSNVGIAESDRSWWTDNSCQEIPFWLIGRPGFFVVGGNDDG